MQSAPASNAAGLPHSSPIDEGNGTRSVVTVGVFDGVHKGHQALIALCEQIARASRPQVAGHGPRARQADAPHTSCDPRVIAIVLDPHPASVLAPGQSVARLTTFAQRERLLKDAGADVVVRMDVTAEMLAMAPDQFVERVVREHRPIAWVEGPDFRFGKERAGNIDLLRMLGQSPHNFAVHVAGERTGEGGREIEATLTDQSIVPCRSTVARWLIAHGRMRDAAEVLGRFYTLDATVVRGDRFGRTIGFPTANLACGTLLPADGVYAGIAKLDDGRTFAAAISVGTKPTFKTETHHPPRAVEAYLLGAPREHAGDGERPNIDGLPEYGWRLDLSFIAYLRDQVKFASLDDLVAQIARDCDQTARIAQEHLHS